MLIFVTGKHTSSQHLAASEREGTGNLTAQRRSSSTSASGHRSAAFWIDIAGTPSHTVSEAALGAVGFTLERSLYQYAASAVRLPCRHCSAAFAGH